nr:MAG TPA: hypothetical protein [Caudoviricetes sp.]
MAVPPHLEDDTRRETQGMWSSACARWLRNT